MFISSPILPVLQADGSWSQLVRQKQKKPRWWAGGFRPLNPVCAAHGASEMLFAIHAQWVVMSRWGADSPNNEASQLLYNAIEFRCGLEHRFIVDTGLWESVWPSQVFPSGLRVRSPMVSLVAVSLHFVNPSLKHDCDFIVSPCVSWPLMRAPDSWGLTLFVFWATWFHFRRSGIPPHTSQQSKLITQCCTDKGGIAVDLWSRRLMVIRCF